MTAKVVFWDVQHGHASVVKTPNGRHIVIDLGVGSYGDSDEEFSPLLHLKDNWGVEHLDYVVITHPHLDHIDDILNFDALSPKVFSRPKHLSKEDVMKDVREQDLDKFNKYFEINDRYNEQLGDSDPRNPYNPDNMGGMIIKRFGTQSCSTNNINDHSLIRVFSYADTKIVFTGDNESCSLNTLLEDEFFVSAIENADILLAPHHGREAGFHNDFLNYVNPRLIVISDGRFCDTSATSRYSAKCRGWKVHKRSGGDETRKCITTRNDGIIIVKFGKNSDGRSFLSVQIN